jgi:aspartyl-tRNA(Asn)/glutamyl-tRNA(Gln) amidotransferase subunit C
MKDDPIALVDRMAALARLALSPQEVRLFARQLAEVLDYAESLQALDLTGVPPMRHAGEGELFRADEPAPGLARSVALDGAPDAEDGLFRVPRVLG